MREIKDPEIRRGLLQRLATRLAGRYSSRLEGKTLRERMTSLAQVFTDRKIPFEVDPTTDESKGELPMLRALACPYPDLAEQDRSVCSLEKMLFSELLGENMRLAECRLDGGNCCTFQPAFG